MPEIKMRQDVTTPNGDGVVQGFTIDDNGNRLVIVRHDFDDITKLIHGICWTPRATKSGLWVYEEEDVKETSNAKHTKKSK